MALWLTAALAAGTLAGCGGSSDQGNAAPTTAAPAEDAKADTTAAAGNEATSRLRRTTWASPEHLLLPALTHPLTGDLKPTLPTCLCTMSIWQTASPPQMQ